MGGKGSGGARPGAGRKPVSARQGELSGSRRAKARARKRAQHNQTSANQTGNQTKGAEGAVSTSETVVIPEAPGNLTLDELAVWNELAPLALKEGTLTDSTRFALRDLCEGIVLKRKLLREVGDEGVTVFTRKGDRAAHPLLTQFRGLMQRVEAGMVRFKLSPIGKEIETPKPAESDPFGEFDDPQPSAAKSSETTH